MTFLDIFINAVVNKRKDRTVQHINNEWNTCGIIEHGKGGIPSNGSSLYCMSGGRSESTMLRWTTSSQYKIIKGSEV